MLMMTANTAAEGGALITNQNITRTSALNPQAGYRLNSTGTADKKLGTGYTILETWLLAGVNSDYECRATLLSGSTPAGTLNTWMVLSTAREWVISDITPDDAVSTDCTILVEIRRAATGTVVTSANIFLSSEQITV